MIHVFVDASGFCTWNVQRLGLAFILRRPPGVIFPAASCPYFFAGLSGEGVLLGSIFPLGTATNLTFFVAVQMVSLVDYWLCSTSAPVLSKTRLADGSIPISDTSW